MLIWKNQQTVYNPKPGNWSACHEEEADFYNPPTHNCTNPKPSTTNTRKNEAAKPHFLSNSSNGSGRVLFLLHENFCFVSNITKESRKRTPNALKTLSSSEMYFSNTKGCVVVVLPGDGEDGKKELKKTWTETNGKDDPFFTNCSPSTLRASSVSSVSSSSPSSFSSSCSSSFINTTKSNN